MANPASDNEQPDSSVAPESVVHSAQSAMFGRYRALARLGRGGMADVFLAIAEGAAGVTKLAVVKRLRNDLAKIEDPDAGESGDRFRAMFHDEAQLSARLSHPNIVHTYEVGEAAGALFIAMEYVEGQSLHALQTALRRAGSALPSGQSIRILCEVSSALHYAHELRNIAGEHLHIVHRDVSPQNIMLTYDGGVKLVDFGVAKAANNTAMATEVGTIKGKIRYMAPEHLSEVGADRRADVYSVGVLLWEALSQKRMVRGPNDAAALLALVQQDAPSLLEVAPDTDPALAAVVMRALARDPAARYQTALELRAALEPFVGSDAGAEQLAATMASVFAQTRAKMSERIRKRLVNNGHFDDGTVIVDWESESHSGASGRRIGSHSASRSASGVVSSNKSSTDSVVAAAPPQPAASRPRRASVLWVGLVAFLAAAGGASVIVLLMHNTLQSQSGASEPDALSTLGSLSPSVAPVAATASAVATVPSAEPPEEALEIISGPVPTAKGMAGKAGKYAAPARATGKAEGAAAPSSVAPSAADTGGSGFVTLDTYPWTRVSVGGKVLGNTPLVKVPLAAGTHTLTLENAEEKLSERVTITVKAGETVSKRLAF